MFIPRIAISACLAVLAAPLSAADAVPAAAVPPAPPSQQSLGWRSDGTGDFADAKPPLTWSSTQNVLWYAKSKTSVSSPVPCANQVFCVSEPFRLVALDRATGAAQWGIDATIEAATAPDKRAELRQRRAEAKPIHDRMNAVYGTMWKSMGILQKKPDDADAKAALADAKAKLAPIEKEYAPYLDVVDPPVHSFGYSYLTPVTDGAHVWDVFFNGVALCCDTAGNLTWMRRIEIPAPRDAVAGSPLLVEGKLILTYGGMRALDPATGEQLWSTPMTSSWGTPVVVKLGQTTAILSPTGNLVRVQDGHLIGSLFAANFHTSPIVHDGVVYAVESAALAIALPDSDADHPKPHVLWKIAQLNKPDGADNMLGPSPLYDDGILYTCGCDGHFVALAADSGKILYEHQFDQAKDGRFDQSITRGGDHIYVGGSWGRTYIIDRGPTYHEVGSNALKGWNVASPVFTGERIYLRDKDGIACIADVPAPASGAPAPK